jgi:hypothetical protein
MNSLSYYFYRMKLTCNSWKHWVFTPYEKLETYTGYYSVRNTYWSYSKDKKTVAVNFWYMVNDGYYDMIEELE